MTLRLPESAPVRLQVIRTTGQPDGTEIASLRAADDDWAAYRALSLWIFHTPAGALPDFPPGVPAAASLRGR